MTPAHQRLEALHAAVGQVLGAGLMPRERYLELLAGPAARVALPGQPLPAQRLLGRVP